MKCLLLSLWLLIFTSSVFAQEVTKIDEFSTITCEDYLARMDNIVAQAEDHPSAKVYVFVYGGKTEKYGREGYTNVFEFPQYGLANAKIRSMKKRFPTKILFS